MCWLRIPRFAEHLLDPTDRSPADRYSPGDAPTDRRVDRLDKRKDVHQRDRCAARGVHILARSRCSAIRCAGASEAARSLPRRVLPQVRDVEYRRRRSGVGGETSGGDARLTSAQGGALCPECAVRLFFFFYSLTRRPRSRGNHPSTGTSDAPYSVRGSGEVCLQE